jgi:hypothetical protein
MKAIKLLASMLAAFIALSTLASCDIASPSPDKDLEESSAQASISETVTQPKDYDDTDEFNKEDVTADSTDTGAVDSAAGELKHN